MPHLLSLKEFVGQFSQPAAVLTREGVILAASDGFADALGAQCLAPGRSVITKYLKRSTGRDVWASELRPGVRRCFQVQGRSGLNARIEVVVRSCDGPCCDEGKNGCLIMLIMGTAPDREADDGGLELSELGYELALQGGADGMWEWNPLTKDLFLSPRLLAIFGYPSDFKVRTTDDWLDLVHPEDRARYNRENSRHLRRETQVFHCEFRVRRADGSWGWGYSRGLAHFDEFGVARRMAGSITDISSRKSAEAELERTRQALELLNASLEERVAERTRELAAALEELRITHSTLHHTQDQLVRAETMASLGRMVAVIAHELNTPIGNARMAASTLHEQAADFLVRAQTGLRRSELDGFLDTLETGTRLLDSGLQRAASLISSFKQVAVDQTSAQQRRFDMTKLMDEIKTTLEPGLRRSGVAHQWKVQPGLSLISYPGPLGQILINLIENALIHAFEGMAPGTIQITVEAEPGDWVRIDVSDNGRGIDEPDQKKIFDPFYTTRMGRGGTGLGLSIVYNLMTGVLGGTIHLQSAPGAGSRFVIRLPCQAPSLGVADTM